MTKKKLLLLTLGLTLGLVLTACAGVATGQVDLPVIGGPMVDVIDLPVAQLQAPNVMQAHAVDAARAVAEIQQQIQQQVQTQTQHWCRGDD